MNRPLLTSLLLGCAALVGCDGSDNHTPATPPAQDQTGTATGGAAATTGEAAGEAQAKLDQVMQYIKENKYDMADKTLKELETRKSSLPVSLQPRVDQARQALNAARGAGGNMPAMPTMPQ